MNDNQSSSKPKPSNNQKKGGNNRNRNRNRRKNPNVNKSINQNGPKKPDPAPQVDEEEEDAPDHHYCLICYNPTLHEERGIVPCGHDTVCASCHLRLRSLLSDKKCPICKANNEELIIDRDPDPEKDEHKAFDDYERWGSDIGPNHIYREDVGMFFPQMYYHTKVTPLFALSCNVPNCQFTNDSSESNEPGTLKALTKHLATAHSPPLQICDLCITHKRDFISRLPRFTSNQLKEHNKHGDLGAGKKASGSGKANKGHPLCNFCAPKRFYDLTELHQHLNKDHYECHVCKRLEKPLQFFKDYNKLNLHFDREHFLCKFPECLAARFVVFPNEIDLKAHERDVHGLISGGSTKIQMEFKVRGSGFDGSGVVPQQQVPNMEEDFGFGLDGEVFVPESLDDNNGDALQHNEPEITHGPHAERTAMFREQARVRREELGVDNSQEAFPTLGNQGTGNLISWSREGSQSAASAIRGRNTTGLNEENFPSLGRAGDRKPSAKVSKLRVTKGASASFQAITNAANIASSSSSRPFANAATTNAYGRNTQSNLSANNFPSLGASNATVGRNSQANLSANNFPTLGQASSSGPKYVAAQAFAKKNKAKSSGQNMNLDQHFPSLGVSSMQKKSSILDRKPAANTSIGIQNTLAFPPPTASSKKSNGQDQVEGMKRVLGQFKYKQLKKCTKEFAVGSLDPESYVASIVHLFDDGIKDPCLWEFIPDLISSCPNESKTKRALKYLESLRYSSGQGELTTTNQTKPTATTGGWSSTAVAAGSTLASVRSTSVPMKYGAAAKYAPSISKQQTVNTGFSGRSLPITQAKNKSSWNGNTASISAVASTKAGSRLSAAAVKAPVIGTATKFMAKQKAKERKVQSQVNQNANANTKKKNSKAKKQELRNLAFGM